MSMKDSFGLKWVHNNKMLLYTLFIRKDITMDNIKEIETWSSLSVKDKCGYATSIASFILGWILIFFSFFAPPIGIVEPSVISVFGLATSYTGAVLGISLHYRHLTQKNKLQYEQELEGIKKHIQEAK